MAETKDMQGYNNLLSNKLRVQQQYSYNESRVNSYTRKIERLKAAKREVANKKIVFNNIIRNDRNIVEEDYKWKGKNYRRILKTAGSEMLGEDQRYYNNSIDRVLDAINDEITELQNKRRESLGIMNGLLSDLNYIRNEIENYFN